MGFLKSLLKALSSSEDGRIDTRKNEPAHARTKVPEANNASVSIPKARYSLTLEGDAERTVYTYDGSPLKGTRKGSVLYADVVTTPMRLHSDVTGSDWDSAETGGVALAVNGKVFGMTSTLEKTFKELAAAGYSVKVKIKRVGMYCEGIPQVVLMIPEPREIFHWRDACKALGREVSFEERHSDECDRAASMEDERVRLSRSCGKELPIGVDGDVFFFNDESWPGKKPESGSVNVSISSELIPTPKGSSAKPHIVVTVDGTPAVELSARNRQYSAMSHHIGERPYFANCQKYSRDDGSFAWKVTVVYLSKKE